ncbi:hypothetical protein LOY70_00480 [Pseudomonas sp. B21-054]|uniref:hypothetical protein n=1 Tax=Pseudomonas sp. B21-054 TaxID=2895494 RepID=UPI00222FB8D9|nr:hypothetical protein [Pseudomonas sp. B21-054]UZE18100.1 hypothetical protein LOY70_00480 [Pseudomonas sp. B21-054]
MSEITQLVMALVLPFLLDQFLKPYLCARLGMVLVTAGAVGCVAASQVWGCCRSLPWLWGWECSSSGGAFE